MTQDQKLGKLHDPKRKKKKKSIVSYQIKDHSNDAIGATLKFISGRCFPTQNNYFAKVNFGQRTPV